MAAIGISASLGGCCDNTCVKAALVVEAEGGPEALTNAAANCCGGCFPGSEVTYPGRCLEVFAGKPEENRVVDLWDCELFDWMRWTWTEKGALQNIDTKSCLTVLGGGARQSSACATYWSFTPHRQLKEAASGKCLFVDTTVTGKDRDANFTEWPKTGDSDWNTYAGSTNGAHVSLRTCSAAPVPVVEQWIVQDQGAEDSFQLRTALNDSSAIFGQVESTCGTARSIQTCAPPNEASQWPGWVLANRAAAATEARRARQPDVPAPGPADDPYTRVPWLQTTFVSTQMMVHDTYFYNVTTGEYTVNRYLDDLEERFGGIDSVLMWYPYPNLGVDERTQLDFLASMPGGLPGVKKAVQAFHKRGVSVLVPFTPWDTNSGASTPRDLGEIIAKIDADGFNGDTMTGIPYDYFSNVTAALGRPAVLEPEQGMTGASGLACKTSGILNLHNWV